MLVYTATRDKFRQDVLENQIAQRIYDAYRSRSGRSTKQSEITSWANSMMFMNNALQLANTPSDAGIAIEFHIPQSGKRIDFILTGSDEHGHPTAVIVELKQWSEVEATNKDGIVVTLLQGRMCEVTHPSYQAWSYAALLQDFNEAVYAGNISLQPCAYVHNCQDESVLRNPRYGEYTSKAPVFLKGDARKLGLFLKKYVRAGDNCELLYQIDQGRIRPSKNLADCLASLLDGHKEFLMIDDQKLVFEKALELAGEPDDWRKRVLIVNGGPGTGKSVVAINLLVELIQRSLVAQYVTRNAAPRHVYESKLSGSMTKTRITNLFRGSGAFTEAVTNEFDALIVDEAHRLNEKSGMFQNLGENQIKEMINAARLSVFFLDEQQKVTFRDIGNNEEIRKWASAAGAEIHEMELLSQFRCNGSDGYLAWLDNTLEIRQTANDSLEDIDFDFRVCDSASELRRLIIEKNKVANRSRMVAGYCWDWASKKKKDAWDIEFPNQSFAMQWNLSDDGHLWILKPDSINQIGCIHTCQGLELDYVGVIIGPDLVVRDGILTTVPDARSKQDSSIKGYKKLRKENPAKAEQLASEIIKNTYRTLLTRGQKGCFVYCTDLEMGLWLKAAVGNNGQPRDEHGDNF